ncbi:putative RNA-directed DNA polymerase from transposon X-element [Caerostris extrusa]|uniref:RNA-directed DNA polymerase from transposon X-element n=1 Tax=Caerostris extrusa TaxID=172846 RepID=A0AAV4Q946_CAEEX|nr:putative RNA-directed DNA polymerase from transposon X-element [Caerostris extrusa]
MPLFQIQLAPTTNIEEIWALDNLLFTKNHCGKVQHKSITERTETPVCANCHGSHPASYRGCPKFPKLNNPTNKQPAPTVTFTSNYAKPNISYSAITSSNSNTTNSNDTPSLLTTLKDAVLILRYCFSFRLLKLYFQKLKKLLILMTRCTPSSRQLVKFLNKMRLNFLFPTKLTICTWNANGLLAKIDELKHFLETYSPDILLIQETHLRPGTRSPQVANYTFYRTDKIFNDSIRRDLYPGGTAIFIKSHIPHHNIPSPTLNTVQTTIVQLHDHHNPFTVISTYIPPQRKTPTDPNRNFFSFTGPHHTSQHF